MTVQTRITLIFAACFLFSCTDSHFNLPPRGALYIAFDDSVSIHHRLGLFKDTVLKYGYIDMEKNIQGIDPYGLKIGIETAEFSRIGPPNVKLEYPYYTLVLGSTDEGDLAKTATDGVQWIIDWPTGLTDTLFTRFNYDPDGPNECECSHPVLRLLLNNKPFTESIAYSDVLIYIFG